MIGIKRWDSKIEEEIIKELESQGEFSQKEFNINEGEKVIIFDTPPPYVGPSWHIGAVISYAFQDIIVRSLRKIGYNVLYPLPFDNNGLPVEWYLEKYEGKTIFNTPREEFIKMCSSYLKKWTKNMENIMKRFFLSGIYSYYWTDQDNYRLLTQRTFIKLWKNGLIYIDKQPVIFCPHCKTTISKSEIEYKEVKGKLYYIKFKTEESKDIVIATTRPELLKACQVIIFNPKDERYKDLEGKYAIVPIYGKKVKIIKSNYADPEFGTGLVMICSYGDYNDVKILRDLEIKGEVLINKDCKISDGLLFENEEIEKAREIIVKKLKEKNLIVDEIEITHQIPVHERCKRKVEIVELEEYFLKQVEFKEELKKIVNELKFNNEKYKYRLLNWIDSITMDWPISRDRYYGTEIPVWKCENCNYIYVPEKLDKYVKPWKEEINMRCPKCNGKLRGEEKIFDTWFDSSNTVLYLCKMFEDEEFFKKAFNSFKIRPQGYEIIRTWLYYSLLKVYLLTEKRAFDYVFINGMGLDEKGLKMSKSLGNVIDPWEIANEFGSDALRFWIFSETSIDEDYKISKEKIKGCLKFLNKLLSISRFISQFEIIEEINENEIKATDRWIIANLSLLIEKAIKTFEELKGYMNLGREIRKFTEEILSSHYIEMVKKRAFEKDKSALFTLHFVLKNLLNLLSPVIPAITYYIYKKLYGKNVHKEKIEKIKYNFNEYLKYNEILMSFNSTIWKMKKEQGKSLKDPIEVEIPKELEIFKKDLISCHNIVKLS